MKLATLLIASSLITACVTPHPEARPATPADVVVAGAMASQEVARPGSDETLLGWGLDIVGDRATVHTCTAEDACGMQVVELSAKSIVSVKNLGRTRPTAANGAQLDDVQVVRLTLDRPRTLSRGGVASDPTRGIVVGPTR